MNNTDDQNGRLCDHVERIAHDVRTPLTSIAGFGQLLVVHGTLSPDGRVNSEFALEEAKGFQ